MKRILTTTALVALMAGPALAESHSMDSPFRDAAMENEIRASEFIGARVYVTEAEFSDELLANGVNEADKDWEDIGEINDVLMNRDGEVEAILVDVGGFLGMGEKTIAVQMDSLKLISDGDDADDYFIVFTGNRALVDEAPEFRSEMDEDMKQVGAEATEAADEMKQETADATTEMKQEADEAHAEMKQEAAELSQETDQAAAEVEQEANEATAEMQQEANEAETEMKSEMAQSEYTAPTIEREGYQGVKITEMTSEELTGASVYHSNDERVGEIAELIVTDDGKISDAIIDVGGFLGMGEKPVALNFQELSIQKEVNGDDLRVYVGATEEQLEEMPTYEK